ncbi:uncharacterized protein [Elaeis guineensis]|nr:uncharacterized protein LOC105055647 isoform X2 [Elaeis guineensis]XP_029123538.1 uncharacterized protein LOC105055647 isoform X2 [Elaeis guineensis]
MMPEQKIVKPEKEGQDPLDSIIKQAIGKEPLLSFSRTGDSPVQWIQLLHALDQQGSSKVSKGARVDNGVGGKEHSLELCNGLSSEMNGVKEFVHPLKDGVPAKGKKSTSEQMQTLKIPEAVVAFAQAAAKANGEPEKYLPGWPLLSPSKVPLLKCDKCSREFCSPINHRRHVRVHRRSLNIDKDSSKNREFLAAFWDKLCPEEAKEITSFADMAIEEVAGSSIIKALSSWIRKPGFSSLPQIYVKAGFTLLDIVQSKPSRFPMSSKELFNVLDDASENTFLCAGTAVSLQKFVFDGEAGKIAMEMKNLVACISFLLEQKLVKAWFADKDAEALRCQKLLVEEEEAAQKRQAELLERKRMKKLRQKEQKAKDLTTDVNNNVSSPGTVECPSGSTGTPSPRAPSESELYTREASFHEDLCSLEPAGSPDPDAEANIRVNMHNEDADQNMDYQKQMEDSTRQPATVQYLPSKPARTFRNGFNSGHSPSSKCSISVKHVNYKDPKSVSLANWHKIWTRKSKPDNEEGFSDRVNRKHRDQPVIIDNSEVLIGSISVTLGQRHNHCQDSSLLRAGRDKEKLAKADSIMTDINHSGAKMWKPVAHQENRDCATIRSEKRENKMDEHTAETASQISPDKNCLASGGMDDSGFERCEDMLVVHRSPILSGPMLFSSKDAEAFLAWRWKEAVASDHVQLVLPSETEAWNPFNNPELNCTEAPMRSSDSFGWSIPGSAEKRMAGVVSTELQAGASKRKFRLKPEKICKLKYVPKQRNNALGE